MESKGKASHGGHQGPLELSSYRACAHFVLATLDGYHLAVCGMRDSGMLLFNIHTSRHICSPISDFITIAPVILPDTQRLEFSARSWLTLRC